MDKDLNPEEIRDFENAMAADKDLVHEVELHADMQEMLADTPENNLRKSLEKLTTEAIEDTPGFDWRLLALIPIVFAIISFLMFGTNEEPLGNPKTTLAAVDTTSVIPTKDSLLTGSTSDTLSINEDTISTTGAKKNFIHRQKKAKNKSSNN
ncbi:MAG: hypothetical protein ACI85O_002935 [Saprospiraceae bacterium]